MSKEWNHGVFSCFDDMGTCCFSYFCGCCQLYKIAEKLGRSGPLYLTLAWLTGSMCIPMMMLRTELREKYDIEGGQWNDALCASCCGFCVMVQTAAELKDQGVE